MKSRFTRARSIPYIFWFLALSAIAIWAFVPSYVVGWDLEVYENAIRALRVGHDPYLDGIAVQRAFHATLAQHPDAPTPFTYVYSPLTLPLMKFIARFPLVLSATIYWTLYWVGLFTAIWVGLQAVEEKERYVFALIAPVVVFFPGLIQNDVLFSGNVAYVLYGLVFATAWLGWKRGNWTWFYLATLAASCCKAPLLSLLVIPVLSARKQWVPTILTGATGLVIFALQPKIWPELFQNYLTAVELQFSFNRDFGSSPAGLGAYALYDHVPYTISSPILYLAYAIPAFCVLYYLSRRFLAGKISLDQWIPVVSVGAILMNPRIMEYDVAPITAPMALIAWRFFARGNPLTRAAILMGSFFLAANATAIVSWRATECCILVLVFVAGVWTLFEQVRDEKRKPQQVLVAEHR